MIFTGKYVFCDLLVSLRQPQNDLVSMAINNLKSVHIVDSVMRKVDNGELLGDVEYMVGGTKMKGGWMVVDGGYLKVPTAMCPFKATLVEAERKWSKWFESVRKNVECAFGILKCRWRIFRSPLRLHNTKIITKCWKTCCALHNMLL
jgi:hypothetical protein